MAESSFDTLYNASKEVMAAAKKPLVKNKVERGFDAAIDTLETKKIDLQEKIENYLAKIANGEVNLITDMLDFELQLEETGKLVDIATAKKAEFFDEKK